MKAGALSVLVLCLCLIAGTASCSGTGDDASVSASPTVPRATPRDLSAATAIAGDALNSFALRLLACADDGDANVVICTQSAGIALGMLRVGAKGATADQLDEALGFTRLSTERLLEVFQQLSGELQAAGGSNLSLIHGMYVGEGPTVKEKYVENIKNYFDASVNLIDFSKSVTLEIINDWVGQVTGGRVDRLYEELKPDLNILLVDNAIYSGRWMYAFSEDATVSLPFAVEKGNPVVTSIMFGQVRMGRYTGADADCAYIPLDDGQAEVWVILPPPKQVLSDFVESLTMEHLLSWRSQAVEQEWMIELPRLNLTWSGDLCHALSEMGVIDLFDADAADLSGMGSGLALSQATHRSQFTLTEEGKLDPVITNYVQALQAAKQDEEIFMALRPFMFMVVNRETNAVLFAGFYRHPLS
jgi:serpin B